MAGSGAGILRFMIVCALVASGPPVLAADAGPLQARDYKMAGDASRTRVVLHFDREPETRWFLLRAPHRLVVDVPETRFLIAQDELAARGMVEEVRYGNLRDGVSRMILSLDGPFAVEAFEVLENADGAGYRLVADLVASTEAHFEAALADQAETTGATSAAPKGDRLGDAAGQPDRRFTIVIDPGHGGIDGGANGPGGTVEKAITLAFSMELRDKLVATGLYDVHLTRESDVFLRLDERVRIARQHGADLFISVHADTVRQKDVSGATVYTVSDRASDAASAAKAARENLADHVAGIEMKEENREVADILADLIRRETHTFSMRFARSLVGELSDSIDLINNPHRFAGFKVLRAPDVPSVLLELGYLSNATDEKQLSDPAWRARAADSILSAVDLFAGPRNGAGG